MGIIREATEKAPRTFTELLRATKLSRKTLNLRLKELCMEGVLVKEEGYYRLNGSSHVHDGEGFVRGLSGVFQNKRIRTGMMLLALLAFSSVSGYVLAAYFPPPREKAQEPLFLGTFTMNLDVVGAEDLYAWQAVVNFDSGKLEAIEISRGDFIETDFPFFVTADDVPGIPLLLAATCIGNAPGKSGSGTLATITFGYRVENYELPTVVQTDAKTYLLNSGRFIIPLEGQTQLLLQLVG
jgi:DNA-binding Lrp family transcriptional regulator